MAHVIENNLLRINPNLFNVFPLIFLPAAGLWNPTAGKSIQGEDPEFSVLFRFVLGGFLNGSRIVEDHFMCFLPLPDRDLIPGE